MLKKLLLFGILGIFSISSQAQQEKVLNLPSFDKPLFHYGFYLGLNSNGYKVAYKPSGFNNAEVEVSSSVGFNVGLIADLRLHNNVNLRFEPGLMSNTKTLTFKHIAGADNVRTREVGATYLHLPLILKLSTNRLNNIRPYVLGGISYDYNFSSNENNSDDNFAGEFRTTTSNFMYEIGIGVDFYLSYFKFSPSIRGVFAVNNELKYDNRNPSQWTDPIDFLGTRGVFLHLSFE
ncbi:MULTISPECIES: porin family protein [unclassified Tenacibaculum]|uniref:type IX secretion/gliding motility protein PorT/SprT n=1 Tax=unclassified Tenacibaculum TaxID=2635139 RepID=UPI001F42B1C4|nr:MULTISPECIES: porin family protein [unclassified Tenacibaculum]MCF2875325.1 PorT family protein [Tenacibaculum sp. Cn5-1]MCF2935401.1 PorT family protein [Tenacibaculum sp. Cn5-34]MCG7511961.1 PorT family protein [Tenacibaculum sp. Cn5-46]